MADNPLSLSPKTTIDANHEACAAYGEDADPQAMGLALDAAFEVVNREISYRWEGRDRYLLALDDIYNGRGDPVEIAREALRGPKP